MKRTLLAGFAVLCLLALGNPLQAQEGNTKEQDIRRMMELTGAAKLAEQIMDQMIVALNQEGTDKAFWDSLRAEFDTQSLLSKTIPIYDKHFTHEEIKGLIAFYESPLGSKLIEKLPAVTQESMAVGMEWGAEVADRVIEKMEERKKKEEAEER
ncbi:MAG TPA: DUF2059 domain-containing protein [Thermoanaerobaculia bacterium]|nr:DUF2059 domain-containing protein [Thermoanaerobaculia bacterium]